MKITKDEVLYVTILEKIDTKDVPLTSHAIFLNNAFREDNVKQSKGAETVLLNAPKKEDGYFVVPKVI